MKAMIHQMMASLPCAYECCKALAHGHTIACICSSIFNGGMGRTVGFLDRWTIGREEDRGSKRHQYAASLPPATRTVCHMVRASQVAHQCPRMCSHSFAFCAHSLSTFRTLLWVHCIVALNHPWGIIRGGGGGGANAYKQAPQK